MELAAVGLDQVGLDHVVEGDLLAGMNFGRIHNLLHTAATEKVADQDALFSIDKGI